RHHRGDRCAVWRPRREHGDAMREERVIALAGALQAAALVRCLATRGYADPSASEASIASIFKIDADNASDVFGGVGNLRVGLQTLVAQVTSEERDLVLTRLLIAIMRVERATMRRRDITQALRDGIEAIGRECADMAPAASDATLAGGATGATQTLT